MSLSEIIWIFIALIAILSLLLTLAWWIGLEEARRERGDKNHDKQ